MIITQSHIQIVRQAVITIDTEKNRKIHDYLTGKIADAQKNKKKAKILEDYENVQFYNGQLEELFSVRKYLTDQINLDTHQYYK